MKIKNYLYKKIQRLYNNDINHFSIWAKHALNWFFGYNLAAFYNLSSVTKNWSRATFPPLYAADIVEVEPMTTPIDSLFYPKGFKDEN